MTPPPVWNWYRVFCILVAIANAAMVPYGAAILRGTAQIPLPEAQDPDTAEAISGVIPALGWSMISTGAAFAILNVLILFAPRKPWSYAAHLLNIILGILSCAFAPLCVPMLVVWLKQPTREFFGMEPKSAPEFEL